MRKLSLTNQVRRVHVIKDWTFRWWVSMSRNALTPDLMSLIVLGSALLVIATSLSFVLLQILQGYM